MQLGEELFCPISARCCALEVPPEDIGDVAWRCWNWERAQGAGRRCCWVPYNPPTASPGGAVCPQISAVTGNLVSMEHLGIALEKCSSLSPTLSDSDSVELGSGGARMAVTGEHARRGRG